MPSPIPRPFYLSLLSVDVDSGDLKKSLPIEDLAYLKINSREVKDRVVSCSTYGSVAGIGSYHIKLYTGAFPMLKGRRSMYDAAKCWEHPLPLAESYCRWIADVREFTEELIESWLDEHV